MYHLYHLTAVAQTQAELNSWVTERARQFSMSAQAAPSCLLMVFTQEQ